MGYGVPKAAAITIEHEFVDIRALEKWALDAGASDNPAVRLWAARFQDAVARERKRDF